MTASAAPTDVITVLTDEHNDVERMFAQLENTDGATDAEDQRLAEQVVTDLEALTPQAPEFWPTVHKLIGEIRQHVAEEEKGLFPTLRAVCSQEQLQELGHKIEQVEKVAPTRPHPASPSEGSALAALAPGAGLADRVRDALSGRGR